MNPGVDVNFNVGAGRAELCDRLRTQVRAAEQVDLFQRRQRDKIIEELVAHGAVDEFQLFKMRQLPQWTKSATADAGMTELEAPKCRHLGDPWQPVVGD